MSRFHEVCAQIREALYTNLWKRRLYPMESVWDAVFDVAENGCDIRWFGYDRDLLDLAIRDGLPRVVQRLLVMGLNPAILSLDGWNAMHLAAYVCTSPKVFMVLPVELLTGRSGAGSTPLHIAVHNRNVQVVQWMLEQPCCLVEAKNADNKTALDRLWETDTTPEAVAIRAAFAARKRWTALRAAWVGAVISCAK